MPTLTLIGQEREWKGLASTTQLLNGTMMEFLKITKPYTVDPDSRAFMLQGTKHHESLEAVAHELGLPAEVALNIDRDIFDLIEYEQDKMVITDYKLWGSFKVAKALGLTEAGKKPDPSGAVYKTNSKYGSAGSPKMVTIWEPVPDNVDNWETELQLNRYRVMLGDLGIKIHRLQLQVTVRDGGIAVASSRGVTRNVYRIPIRILPDEDVRNYFQLKADSLAFALKENYWGLPCSDRESWDGKLCSSYCDVAGYCPKGILIQRLDNKEENYG